jgi:hypothetical protein
MIKVTGSGQRSASDAHHRVISTVLSVFSSTMSLLGEPTNEGVIMPGPASMACVRNLLESMQVGKEEGDVISRYFL